MKISAKTKDYRLMVKVKTSGQETVDEKELDRFARLYLRCFLKPKMIKRNLMEYTGPIGISLKERFKKEITKRDFLFVLEHIVVAAQKLIGNKFPLCNFNMDMQYIYINETTKELQFLYVPLTGQQGAGDLIELFTSVIYLAQPAPEKDTEYISRFNYFFKSMKPFNLEKIEQFIQQEDRSVVNTIKKHNAGQSGFMTSDHRHYYDHVDEQKKIQEADATDRLEEDPVSPQFETEEATGLLTDFGQVAGEWANQEEATGRLTGENPGWGNAAEAEEEATGLLSELEEATGLLTDFGQVAGEWTNQEEATGRLTGENPGWGNAAEAEEEATGLLTDVVEEGTTLLIENQAPAIAYPELFRVLTGETILVNKPVFRMGKERSYVDYFVTNNSAVSRSHADIITREAGCFVIDLNSKNRTYINNQAIPVQVETAIHDGDQLRLGNEEFVFHMGKLPGTALTCPNCKAPIKPDARFCTSCGTRLQANI